MFDAAVIGGGRAGLAAAISAYDNGVKDILVVEREDKLGGFSINVFTTGLG